MKRQVWLSIALVTSVACYKFKILNITNCSSPDPPMLKNVRDKWIGNVEAYTKDDKILMKGNVTVLQDLNFYARFTVIDNNNYSPRQRDNKIIDLKGITCRNIIVRMMLQFANIKYDPKNCKVRKGNYVFKDLDIDRIEQTATYIPGLKLGPKLWYFTLYQTRGAYVCFDIRVLYY